MENRYAKGQTDEFLEPIILDAEGTIRGVSLIILPYSQSYMIVYGLCQSPDEFSGLDDDVLLFFNFRSDRMRQIVETFGLAFHFEPSVKRERLVRRSVSSST
jgi:bisphosphoglycerate-independent phosphoglycerate mutase (AlkP superfamily)